ncbi:MAG: hypothetical protein SGARI_007815, partial [Bacillariaceae sp.]
MIAPQARGPANASSALSASAYANTSNALSLESGIHKKLCASMKPVMKRSSAPGISPAAKKTAVPAAKKKSTTEAMLAATLQSKELKQSWILKKQQEKEASVKKKGAKKAQMTAAKEANVSMNADFDKSQVVASEEKEATMSMPKKKRWTKWTVEEHQAFLDGFE